MNNVINNTWEQKLRFSKNVCSSRTNLGLLPNLRKEVQCNRGMESYD